MDGVIKRRVVADHLSFPKNDQAPQKSEA